MIASTREMLAIASLLSLQILFQSFTADIVDYISSNDYKSDEQQRKYSSFVDSEIYNYSFVLLLYFLSYEMVKKKSKILIKLLWRPRPRIFDSDY